MKFTMRVTAAACLAAIAFAVAAPAPAQARESGAGLAAPSYTTSQEQAIMAAESYLDLTGFSRKGLIKQLSSKYGEGFPLKDAIFAVDHVSVNWYQEAVEAARNYLDLGGFSRNSLIRQLESPYGEQFTHAQAVYAAKKVGL